MNEATGLSCPAFVARSWDDLWPFYREYDSGTFSAPNNKSIHWIFRGDKKSKKDYDNARVCACETCGKGMIDCLCPHKDFRIPIREDDLRTHLEKAFADYGVADRQGGEKAL